MILRRRYIYDEEELLFMVSSTMILVMLRDVLQPNMK